MAEDVGLRFEPLRAELFDPTSTRLIGADASTHLATTPQDDRTAHGVPRHPAA